MASSVPKTTTAWGCGDEKRGGGADTGNCKEWDHFGGHFVKYDASGDIFAYALAEDLGTCTCATQKFNSLGIIYAKCTNSVAKKAVKRNFGK